MKSRFIVWRLMGEASLRDKQTASRGSLGEFRGFGLVLCRPFGRWTIREPRQCARLAAPNDRLGDRSELLAISDRIDADRLVKLHHHVDGTGEQTLPEMGNELHVAVPGEKRTILTAHRHAVKAYIGRRHGLHENMLRMSFGVRADGRLDRTHERAFEGKHAVAVARCPFWEKNERIPGQQPL